MSEGMIRLIILIAVVSAVLLIGMIIFGFWMFDFALVRKEQMDFDAGDDLLPHMDVIRFRSREAQEKIRNNRMQKAGICAAGQSDPGSRCQHNRAGTVSTIR